MGSLLGHALGLWSEGETLVGGHQASSSVAAFLATDPTQRGRPYQV